MKHRLLYTLAFLFATLQTFAQSTTKYEYDEMYRLTKVTYGNGVTVTYTYDELGNRQSKKIEVKVAYIDELATAAPAVVTDVDALVLRTINAGEWSTICLPFSMTEAQVKSAFGSDVELGDFAGCEVNGDHITAKFDKVTVMEASHPYIIKVSAPVSEFKVKGVDVAPTAAEVKKDGSGGKYNSFIGNYENGKTLDDGTLFLYGNNFCFSNGSTKIKGLRGYFKFDAAGATYASRIAIEYDDATAIRDKMRETADDSRYYNLSGQQVDRPAKGVYVKKGKKVIIK